MRGGDRRREEGAQVDLSEAREKIKAVDEEMASLFKKRMEIVRDVAAYKRENGLPVEDPAQEAGVIEGRSALIEDPELRPLYVRFLQDTMDVSKTWQRILNRDGDGGNALHVDLGEHSYDIVVSRGCLKKAGEHLSLDRKVLIVTDDGVPSGYAATLAAACGEPYTVTIPQGEGSKSLAVYEKIIEKMLEAGFDRSGCVCAVGGGVVGDLAGFAAATYMRGVDFYSIPTTLLSQVDSSIGGKTAVDLRGVKNAVGAFWQPKKVLIDPDTLKTLSPRETACGMAEAVKTALIGDKELFRLFEEGKASDDILPVIKACLAVKKAIVELDERDTGVRKTLNFGHTIGHAVESVTGLHHGECVALGMIPMCAPEVRERLLPVLESLGLPTEVRADPDEVFRALMHDKKMEDGLITAVYAERPGSCVLREVRPEELRAGIDLVVKK